MRWPFRKNASSNKEEARRHYNSKDYDKAEPFLEAMLSENPNDLWALDVLSRLFMNTARHGDAVTLMQRAIASNPKPEYLRRIVHAGCISGDCSTVVRIASRITWTYADEELLSRMFETFWHEQSCRDFFLRSDWNMDIPFPIFVQAKERFESGDVEGGIELLDSLMSREVVNESTLMFARQVCESLGQIEMAHNLWVNYLQKIEGELSKKRSLAKRLKHAKRFDESAQIASMVLQENPDDLQMLEILTEIGYRTKTPQLALEAYHRLNDLGEVKLYHLRRFANAAINDGSVPDILLASKRLIELGVDAKATIRNSYLKLCELDRIKEAEQLLQLIEGTLLETDLTAARMLEEGDAVGALDVLDVALASHSENVSFLMRKGIALESMGRLQDAIGVFEQVLDINKNHQSAVQRRLKCGIKVWSEEKYSSEITTITKQHPENLNHQFARLNFVLSVLKDYDLALEIVRTCLKHHPNNQRSQLYFALVNSWLGNHRTARNTVSKCLVRWPESNDVHITASQIEKNAGQPQMQINHINNMLELHGLAPIRSSSPVNAITPQYLSTDVSKFVDDERLVSIIMTTYKRDPLLDSAIASILNQTYRNVELLIVDDCSPDDNFTYLQTLKQTDARIRVFQMNENGGTYLAKNFGISQAKGTFIGFMDSDDYCHAQRIEMQVDSLSSNPEAVGITHDYFRIDENSDVEFRGIGALRMACISLLIRREVVDDIGYFDSLRVGADTEYIERIEAYYGNERRLRMSIPSMFMMLHNSSLTGGGPFHISWRSVSGHRLNHHCSFRLWHRKIKSGITSPYLPRRLSVRPFEVPDAMKSKHHAWETGMPLFSEMIRKRNHDWWKAKKPVWQKKLSPKLAGRRFVEDLGLKVPVLHWEGKELRDIPELASLPRNFVIKPEKGWNSNNVYCMRDGTDVLTHQAYTREDLVRALTEDEFIRQNQPMIMIEELLEPEPKQLSDGLPRDFKFYCFGEEIAMVHVALRKSEVNKSLNEHQYYDENFKLMPGKIMEKRDQGQDPIQRPDCWQEMIESVRTIGAALGMYMRIDMFATSRGAVFGEFTPTPHGGNGYTEYADKYLGSFWNGEEGVQ